LYYEESMIPDRLPGIIKLNHSTNFTFKAGDIVTITVIKRLAGNKWAVGIRGKVYPAFSEKDLVSGQKLKAYVLQNKETVFLKCDIPQKADFSDYLIQQNLPDDPLSHSIILNLIKARLSLNPELIIKLRQIIKKMNKKPEILSRLLSIIYEKKIDITQDRIKPLIGLLSYGEDTGEGQKKKNKKKYIVDNKKIKEKLKNIVHKGTGKDYNLLQVFNHMKGENPTWIVIPFNFDSEDVKISGTIRIFYNFILQKAEKMALIVHQNNDIQMGFYLAEKKDHKSLMISCNNEEKRIKIKKEIENLRRKLQNSDVIIDDIIYKGEKFDGFTPLEEFNRYRKINMYT